MSELPVERTRMRELTEDECKAVAGGQFLPPKFLSKASFNSNGQANNDGIINQAQQGLQNAFGPRPRPA